MAVSYHQLGFALFGTGRMEEAIEHFRQAVKLDPTSVHTHHLLALVLSAQGRRYEAIKQLQVAIRFNPNEASLYTALGRCHVTSGR
jgi:Flp pilus assembly protein TadD